MKKIFFRAAAMLVFFTLVLGVIYPLTVYGIGMLFFPGKSEGSLKKSGADIIGSALIAQSFTSERYMHPRPSAANYNAAGSGGSNLAPSNPAFNERIKEISSEGDGMPGELLTTSASGLDPHISPKAALWQAGRIAKARKMTEAEVKELIEKSVEKPFLGFIGEERVNVLLFNLKLDEIKK